MSACFCSPGFIRDESTGDCISLFNCKRRYPQFNQKKKLSCKENEIYTWNAKTKKTCSDRLMGNLEIPVFNYNSPQFEDFAVGCYCENGYLLDMERGRCVLKDDCPSPCDAYQNQIWVEKPKMADRYCSEIGENSSNKNNNYTVAIGP